ncbi:MAG: GNAT family N-acetyltransferase [Wenzhouxiangellaceae bacterium]
MQQQVTDAAIDWRLARYDDLTRDELYAALRARVDVFVVEQQCPYEELDGQDERALHLFGHAPEGTLLAYARILPPGIRFGEPSIGRVLTTRAGRGQRLGRPLMRRAIEVCRKHWPERPIRISAQVQLAGFYGSLGFEVKSEPYDDAGIMHLDMALHD